MNDGAFERLVEMLDESALPPSALDCVLAAAGGRAELNAHLAGKPAPVRRAASHAAPIAVPEVYLEEIAVEGFRGVAERARLQFEPGPGLTLVVGRNGSGKSSFAEGLEVLLTGTTLRWEERTKVWQEGWRNLHHGGPVSLRARFRVDGEPQALDVGRTWPAGAALDSAETLEVSGARTSWEALGWQRPLEQFRPILSYNELGTMFSSPTRAAVLYDALSAVLGLEDFDACQAALREERLDCEKRVKVEKETRAALLQTLMTSDDPRAALASGELTRGVPNPEIVLDAAATAEVGDATDLRRLVALELPGVDLIRERFAGVESGARLVARLEVTDATRLDALAELLERGLDIRNSRAGAGRSHDCPLCGTEDVLDEGWALRAHAEAQELRRRSSKLREARAALASAYATARGLFSSPTGGALLQAARAELEVAAASELWRHWSALTDSEFPAEGLEAALRLEDALEEAQRAAVEEQGRRDVSWGPLRDAISEWVTVARPATRARQLVETLKRAEGWMKTCTAHLRRERLAPVVESALANWAELRHESNIALGAVELRKRGNQRYAAFDVAVDGTEASAFGVMSQGELSALAISIFLPRAALPGSPFAFIVIDDPVQSMDPAKVDGLARVLARASGSRQVIVFTHDERLPEAVRRLDFDARIVQVQRRARSKVEIVAARPPSDRHIGEALAMAMTDDLPAEVRARVVPGLCRSAIEAACAARIRRQLLDKGTAHAEVEAQLGSIGSLTGWLAAALGLGVSQGREVRAAVHRLGGGDAVEVVDLARRGAHTMVAADGLRLARGARALVRALEERP